MLLGDVERFGFSRSEDNEALITGWGVIGEFLSCVVDLINGFGKTPFDLSHLRIDCGVKLLS